MRVLMISPGFPADMKYFTRGLAEVGAQVIGVGDQSPASLEPMVRESLAAYLPLANLWDEDRTIEAVLDWLHTNGVTLDRVECLWEPGIMLAAQLRQHDGA